MRATIAAAVLAAFSSFNAGAVEPLQWKVSILGQSWSPVGTGLSFAGACEAFFQGFAFVQYPGETYRRITRMDSGPPWVCDIEIGGASGYFYRQRGNGYPLIFYQGNLDAVSCNGISGWAWNSYQPTTPMIVTLLADGEFLTNVEAGLFRQDLLNAGKGNGFHAFNLPLPPQLADGRAHRVQAKIGEQWLDYGQSGFSVTCAPKAVIELSGESRTRALPAGPALLQTATVTQGGAALAGETVSIQMTQGGVASGLTDAAGRFSFVYVPPAQFAGSDTLTGTCSTCSLPATKVIEVEQCVVCDEATP
ncbi:carboxypeptidase-like regulatory domain-containing protein [Ramlibacter sp.]|uniref:carboxypeptidase-like regulatory domain-containing protein n=1 Tax=Ramlibacter sp. TaxID=1917967 RepID=UPI003D0F6B4D